MPALFATIIVAATFSLVADGSMIDQVVAEFDQESGYVSTECVRGTCKHPRIAVCVRGRCHLRNEVYCQSFWNACLPNSFCVRPINPKVLTLCKCVHGQLAPGYIICGRAHRTADITSKLSVLMMVSVTLFTVQLISQT